MSQRIIFINPIPQQITIEQIHLYFLSYSIQKIAIDANLSTAYIQFNKSSDIQALHLQYPQCKISTLNAQIGFVQSNFQWPSTSIKANPQNIFRIKNCQNIQNLSEDKIGQIFKGFIIQKIVKLINNNEIIIQFNNENNLQLLDRQFQSLKVNSLGKNAFIDIQNIFPVQIFIQKYLQFNGRNNNTKLQSQEEEDRKITQQKQQKYMNSQQCKQKNCDSHIIKQLQRGGEEVEQNQATIQNMEVQIQSKEGQIYCSSICQQKQQQIHHTIQKSIMNQQNIDIKVQLKQKQIHSQNREPQFRPLHQQQSTKLEQNIAKITNQVEQQTIKQKLDKQIDRFSNCEVKIANQGGQQQMKQDRQVQFSKQGQNIMEQRQYISQRQQKQQQKQMRYSMQVNLLVLILIIWIYYIVMI